MAKRLNSRAITRSYKRGGISRLRQTLSQSGVGNETYDLCRSRPVMILAAAAVEVNAFPPDMSAPIMP
ncbi:MAG TPA: hypothetical protein VK192_04085, partial [Sphingomicrobium sp.]|nr:hypothetical protein [Sphingomicrobium sp.]